jgi:multisubunit Na+/H+ antiporter MnhB subunit
MNRTQLLICACGVLLCYLWFAFATPKLHTDGHDDYAINSRIMAVHGFVWVIILVFTALLFKKAGKK